jgi:ribosome-associated protein
MLEIDDHLAIPLSELHFTFVRSSGPGGQNVNKSNTKVTLRWAVVESTSLPEDVKSRFLKRYARRVNQRGELLVTSQRFRDQGRNVADCLEKLQEMLRAVATPPKTRRPRRPTRASRERRLRDKRKRADAKRLRQRPPRDE